jgi:hypothetical protein
LFDHALDLKGEGATGEEHKAQAGLNRSGAGETFDDDIDAVDRFPGAQREDDKVARIGGG